MESRLDLEERFWSRFRSRLDGSKVRDFIIWPVTQLGERVVGQKTEQSILSGRSTSGKLNNTSTSMASRLFTVI